MKQIAKLRNLDRFAAHLNIVRPQVFDIGIESFKLNAVLLPVVETQPKNFPSFGKQSHQQ